ncbi:ABC transporter permease [Micromonospora sp. NBC_01796]|uniref:ABC transporter permease n=1 Tax=Micromonospora sp. NBC_01796 TaxID=2975987 RepID=UPI002DD7A50F|nr:ABC transporter permease [Micromonospora sp. NBC_01796]WSA83991.1 ABC transporter permease [Micromonospora sp. NBC_01796]
MAPDKTGRPARSLAKLGTWDVLVIVVLVGVIVASSVLVEGFASPRFWGFLLLDVTPIALIALPMTLVVITGEIDLSVASTLGLASAVMGQLWFLGLPLPVILPLVVLLGALLGAVNGLFVAGFGLPSLAVTIGTLALYRGLAYVVLGDRAIADFPFSWTANSIEALPGTTVPWVALVVAALAVVFGVVLHATPIGRSLYAMGNNTQAATFAGISVNRTKFWLYVLTGAIAALAGIFWTLRYASARADNGSGLELSVVAAVLLGGVSIFGGRGTLVGVLAGVLLLMTLRNALQLADVPADTLTVVTGALLIISVVGPNVAQMLRDRLRRRRATAQPVAGA